MKKRRNEVRHQFDWYCGVWSWRLSFFMFFSYSTGRRRAGFSPSLEGRNSRKNTVAVDQEFGHEERALWSEGIRDRNVN